MIMIGELYDAVAVGHSLYMSTRPFATEKEPSEKRYFWNLGGRRKQVHYAGIGKQLLGLASHKKAVAETTLSYIPESARRVKENFNNRRAWTMRGTGLAAISSVQLYFDDVICLGSFVAVRQGLEASTPTRIAAASAAAILTGMAIHTPLGFANKLQYPSSDRKKQKEATLKPADISEKASFADRLQHVYEKVKYHAGKAAMSSYTGVPMNVLKRDFTGKEIIGHSFAWGVPGAAMYETGTNLGILDNPIGPFVVSAAIIGSIFIDNACERTINRATPEFPIEQV